MLEAACINYYQVPRTHKSLTTYHKRIIEQPSSTYHAACKAEYQPFTVELTAHVFVTITFPPPKKNAAARSSASSTLLEPQARFGEKLPLFPSHLCP